MENFYMNALLETELAQAPRLGRGEPIPGDGGDGRGPANGKRFEREGGWSEHEQPLAPLRTIIN
jgi:hypothetical protein